MKIIIEHIKQTVLLLSMFLTLNVYSMVTMVTKSANRRIIRPFLQTRLPLQKKLSREKCIKMINTDSRERYERECIEREEIRDDIKAELNGAFKRCNRRSFLPVINKDGTDCLENYSEQFRNYLKRKYTGLCTGSPFVEKFFAYRTKDQKEARNADGHATLLARRLWKDDKIRTCVQKHLARYDKELELFLDESIKKP